MFLVNQKCLIHFLDSHCSILAHPKIFCFQNTFALFICIAKILMEVYFYFFELLHTLTLISEALALLVYSLLANYSICY